MSDPRFLAGEEATLTDARDMAFVVACTWAGEVDMTANITKAELAIRLRPVAPHGGPSDER